MERLNLTEIVSFDRGFDKVAGLERVEPRPPGSLTSPSAVLSQLISLAPGPR